MKQIFSLFIPFPLWSSASSALRVMIPTNYASGKRSLAEKFRQESFHEKSRDMVVVSEAFACIILQNVRNILYHAQGTNLDLCLTSV
jgi:hypothetical protein